MNSQVLVEKKKLKNPPLDIHFLGDRVLRQPAKRVAKVDQELRQLAREMLQTSISGRSDFQRRVWSSPNPASYRFTLPLHSARNRSFKWSTVCRPSRE